MGNSSRENQTTPPHKPPVVAEQWVFGPGLPDAGLRLDRTAYRRQERTLRRIALGASQRITQARLETVLREGQPNEGGKNNHTRPEV
ncbi:MAG: hypothetical protein EOM24_07890 [Chloroflexia bacterium]|nr:hypothetical protein [Chloroflexia bacterium]